MAETSNSNRGEAQRERGMRIATGALGSALLVGGLRAGRAGGLLLAAGGASLLAKGITGQRRAFGTSGARVRQRLLAPSGEVDLHRAVTIGRSREEVYAFLQRIEDVQRALAHVSELRRAADGSLRFTVRERQAELEWTIEIVEATENERIAFRSRPGSDLECEGSVELSAAPGDRGTELRLHLRCAPPGVSGRVGRTLAPLRRVLGKHQLGAELGRMKQLIETGEIATSAMRGEEPAMLAMNHGREEVHA